MASSKHSLLNNEERTAAMARIQAFFYEEKGEEMGIIAAGNLLDFFYETLGRDLCRKAIDLYRERMLLKLEDGEAEVLARI